MTDEQIAAIRAEPLEACEYCEAMKHKAVKS